MSCSNLSLVFCGFPTHCSSGRGGSTHHGLPILRRCMSRGTFSTSSQPHSFRRASRCDASMAQSCVQDICESMPRLRDHVHDQDNVQRARPHVQPRPTRLGGGDPGPLARAGRAPSRRRERARIRRSRQRLHGPLRALRDQGRALLRRPRRGEGDGLARGGLTSGRALDVETTCARPGRTLNRRCPTRMQSPMLGALLERGRRRITAAALVGQVHCEQHTRFGQRTQAAAIQHLSGRR